MRARSAARAAAIASVACGLAFGQADTALGWKNTANGLVNLSQVYFDNWTKGGTDALSWELRLEGGALLRQARYDWESKARVVFGQTKLADFDTRKSADELLMQSLYTYKWDFWVNPFAAARFQSQFARGYKYNDSAGTRARVSGPFDPTYLEQTLGLGRAFGEILKTRLGGTLKETFSAARYGFADDAETASEIETFKLEPGLSFNADFKLGLMENILLTSVLDVFVNFKGTEEIDGRWENLVTAKVNKFISVNLGFDALYDKDLSESGQYKQSLAVGISFLSL
jgi:hypothetical protein